MKQIITELKRINRMNWLPTIEDLIHHYDGIKGIEQNNMPTEGILNILQSLHNNRQLNMNAIIGFQQLKCFSYRVYISAKKKDPTKFWNPLEQSYKEFSESATNIDVYQSNQPHPANDIIRLWFAEHLSRNPQQSNNLH